MFEGTGVNVTAEGQRHLGVIIGSEEYKQEFVAELVREWINQIELLSKIARVICDPHSAYAAYIKGLGDKFT